jgi:hypothetical protein
MQLQVPHQNIDLERWWAEARKRVSKSDRRRLDTLIILIAWTLRKQRNARVFGNLRKQMNTQQIVDHVHEEWHMWELARTGGSRANVRG